MHSNPCHSNHQLRSFGLLIGGICVLLGLWPWIWRGQPLRLWGVGLGSALMALGLIRPAALTQLYRLWMRLGEVLGRINTAIILGVLFYGLFTPMGLVMRWRGKDPMRRTLDADVDTYRVVRAARPASHMTHQF